MGWQNALAALCLIANVKEAISYNVADKLPIFKFGPKRSKFGFSVSLHKITEEGEKDASNVYLMAGAPTARATESGLGRTGGVFYCPTTTNPEDCRRVDITIEDGVEDGVKYIADNQWLGVSLKSEGPAKNLVTCAHRYTKINLDGYGTTKETNKVRMCGRCVSLKGDASGEIVEIPGSSYLTDPCKDKSFKSTWTSKRYYGFPQTGVSIAFDDNEYYLGAPGTYSYTGAVFHVKGESVARTPSCEYGDEERFQQLNGRWQCKKIPVTMDSYLGYSLATSSAIDAGSETKYFIAGAPRGNETGAVLFFTQESEGNLVPDTTKSLFGERISSSFGYAIATSDLNGDGLDDLIVGAPQYFERQRQRRVDGAVYVYINSEGTDFGSLQPIKFYGKIESFFGHSVAALGDVDQDGYNDFAVGAPHEDGSGSVHIFRGGKDQIVKSQVLRGSTYQTSLASLSRRVRGFGSSLSTEIDVDANGYPDLLIGTSSDNIVLLRSRPIITLSAELIIKAQEIDLKNKSCLVEDGVRVNYTLELDSILQRSRQEPRVHFGSPDGSATAANYTVVRTPDTKECWKGDQFVYMKNTINDKLTPIELRFKFHLDEPEIGMPIPGTPIIDMSEYPVLDSSSDGAKKSILPIKNTCGDDGCQSGLIVNATMPKEILLGKDEEITVHVDVVNDGEEAHQASADIHLPQNLHFLRHYVDSAEDIVCSFYASGKSSFIRCDLGNPLPAGSNASMNFILSTAGIDQDTRQVIVSVVTTTTSENPKLLPLNLKADVLVELDMQLTQYGVPQQIRYGEIPIKGESAISNVEEIGPPLTYTFEVLNKGVSRSSGINLVVDIPVEIYNHKWLLYLVSADVKSPTGVVAGSCNSSYVNPVGLNVTTISSRKKRDTRSTRKQLYVWRATLLEEYKDYDLVYVETGGRLTTSDSGIRFKSDTVTSMVTTTVDHDEFTSEAKHVFPWWYIVIAIFLLILLYIVIIIGLLRCGFFKRKKYSEEDDEETSTEDKEKLVDEKKED